MMKYSINMRLPKDAKLYWKNQLKEFSARFAVEAVEFGKQDVRGVPSITFFDSRHCVPAQEHFKTTDALLHFVQGYNEAINNFGRLSQIRKEVAK